MNVAILYGIEGAKMARGLTVTIDVFRAFSTACYVMDAGAEKIIPVGDIAIAYQLKKEHPDFVLMGERDGGYIQPGFDFGNSPFQLRGADLNGKTVVQTTSSGTQGIANAKDATEIITGSFVNVGAIIAYIKSQRPADLSLVCTVTPDEATLDEDAACAHYIKNALLGQPNDFAQIKRHLKEGGFARPFFDPSRESHPIEDFDLCLALDKFDFVLRAEPYQDELVCLKRIEAK